MKHITLRGNISGRWETTYRLTPEILTAAKLAVTRLDGTVTTVSTGAGAPNVLTQVPPEDAKRFTAAIQELLSKGHGTVRLLPYGWTWTNGKRPQV